MPSQRRGTALFDGRHDLQLPKAQGGSLSPGRPVEAEDIRDLEHVELGGGTS
nr:hypothetical protein [uncultured Cupriavidus sp.]